MKKVFLDDLPRWESGEGSGNIGTINWAKSVGRKVKFVYDDVDGEIEIVGYDRKRRKLILNYNGEKNEIMCGNFLKGKIGSMLVRYENYKTHDFEIYNILKINKIGIVWDYIEVGEILKTNHSRYGYNEFEFVKYDKSKKRLYLKYNKENFDILSNGFCRGSIGKILNRYTKDYKVEIGDVFSDDSRNLIVIDREYRKKKHGKSIVDDKWYKYKCIKCGYEGWIVEGHLLISKRGCKCCDNKIVVSGINDMATTALWMIKLGVSIEDATRHTKCSGRSVTVKCPDCGSHKKVKISDVFTNKSIGCRTCGDSVSFPEKFFNNVLTQLNIKFETQKILSNNVSNKMRYDFYFKHNNEQYIVEVHGMQHYNGGFDSYGGRTSEEEIINDKYKKQLALDFGINNYIVIDCRYSELEYIKNSILQSKLSTIFDFNMIDWSKCEEFALSNMIKSICNYWNNNKENKTTGDLAKIFGVHYNTIGKILKKGTKLGWTEYNPKYEVKRIAKMNGKKSRKRFSIKVAMYKNKEFVGIFKSGIEIEEKSEELFGVKLRHQSISRVANGKQESYKGYIFKYVE